MARYREDADGNLIGPRFGAPDNPNNEQIVWAHFIGPDGEELMEQVPLSVFQANNGPGQKYTTSSNWEEKPNYESNFGQLMSLAKPLGTIAGIASGTNALMGAGGLFSGGTNAIASSGQVPQMVSSSGALPDDAIGTMLSLVERTGASTATEAAAKLGFASPEAMLASINPAWVTAGAAAASAGANVANAANSGGKVASNDMWGTIASIAGPSIGGLLGMNAANSAADTQAQSASDASRVAREMFDVSRQDQMPWMESGRNALGRLDAGFAPGGDYSRSFGMSDFQSDPGYNFRLSEGEKAIDRMARARGLSNAGGTYKALLRYNQDSASGEFSNAFNRFQLDQSNRFNRNAALAGIGQTAAQQLGGQATQLGQIEGNNIMGAGNARASGYMGGANAFSNAIGQGMNFYNQNQLINRLPVRS
jgi:hypothetical protein